jgi:glutaryl-CoA dehydrogenase
VDAVAVISAREATRIADPSGSQQSISSVDLNGPSTAASSHTSCALVGRLAHEHPTRFRPRVCLGLLRQGDQQRAQLAEAVEEQQVVADAHDMLCGNGVLLENHVIRHMGDIEVIHTYEGTETMQTLIVGRDITGVGTFA